jgi:hypothetical protein
LHSHVHPRIAKRGYAIADEAGKPLHRLIFPWLYLFAKLALKAAQQPFSLRLQRLFLDISVIRTTQDEGA